ncbi:hypothetical protein BDN71DRAFT_1426847 [Pleurotus eryngii]|uniref:Uncharacterized protein n=1 Tax=Pleurotus eryngii TaxID=5323 RepID=A0A9P6A775_PLEER|nr:hypothetical protein BDN71DRAFT_1426847 [Pleurotus eryngii]
MTSVATFLSDSLTSVLKLLSSRKNYTMFSERFKISVDMKGFWGHFDGTTPCLLRTVAVTDEDIANASIETVKECWDAIIKEYLKKGFYARAGLQRQFLDLRCGDKEDVHEFLEQPSQFLSTSSPTHQLSVHQIKLVQTILI